MSEKFPIEYQEPCAQCGKTFDTRWGKIRMNEWFCSLGCADKAYPKFNERLPKV